MGYYGACYILPTLAVKAKLNKWRQVEMTHPGTEIVPKADPKTRRLLETKYKIFLEAIELQKRWRNLMEEAAA